MVVMYSMSDDIDLKVDDGPSVLTKRDDLRNRLLMTYAYEETQIASKHLLLTYVVTLLVKRRFYQQFLGILREHTILQWTLHKV